MKSIETEALLGRLESTVERHLREAEQHFLKMESERLLRPAKGGGWSIAQCLEHLNCYGRYYLPAIAARLPEAPQKKTTTPFKSSWLGAYFTNMMDPKTGSRKIKAMKEYIPQADLDAQAVVKEFLEQQRTLLDLLRRSRGHNLNKIRVPVSIAKIIRLKLGDVFQFFVAHNDRHLEQAKRG